MGCRMFATPFAWLWWYFVVKKTFYKLLNINLEWKYTNRTPLMKRDEGDCVHWYGCSFLPIVYNKLINDKVLPGLVVQNITSQIVIQMRPRRSSNLRWSPCPCPSIYFLNMHSTWKWKPGNCHLIISIFQRTRKSVYAIKVWMRM